MDVVSAAKIAGKKIILRYDIDVPLENGQVVDDFRLKAGLETLKLCLENGQEVTIIGHIGRPQGSDPKYSVAPIYEWLKENGLALHLEGGRQYTGATPLKLLENLRFEEGEETGDIEYAKKLAEYGDFFVNEAFAAYRKAASTTVLPTLLPHAGGLRFTQEVQTLTKVRENPEKPFVVVMGGAKVEDKLPVIKVLADKADVVLVGGKLVAEIKDQKIDLPHNVMVAKMTNGGLDISQEAVLAWENVIRGAKEIVWNGPLGKFEEEEYSQTEEIIKAILNSNAEIVIGGGDSVAALSQYGLLGKAQEKAFVSVGGGAMLKLLSEGTLATIEALA